MVRIYNQRTKSKLTGELKEKVDNAETMEEKKDIIEKAGIELTDDELEKVSGGVRMNWPSSRD